MMEIELDDIIGEVTYERTKSEESEKVLETA